MFVIRMIIYGSPWVGILNGILIGRWRVGLIRPLCMFPTIVLVVSVRMSVCLTLVFIVLGGCTMRCGVFIGGGRFGQRLILIRTWRLLRPVVIVILVLILRVCRPSGRLVPSTPLKVTLSFVWLRMVCPGHMDIVILLRRGIRCRLWMSYTWRLWYLSWIVVVICCSLRRVVFTPTRKGVFVGRRLMRVIFLLRFGRFRWRTSCPVGMSRGVVSFVFVWLSALLRGFVRCRSRLCVVVRRRLFVSCGKVRFPFRCLFTRCRLY